MNSLFNIKNKTVVVTGGLGQLGLAYINAFHQAGANVVAIDKIPENHGIELLNTNNIDGYYLQADITKESEITEVLNSISNKYESIDVLINNAALDSPPNASVTSNGPFEDYSIQEFEQIMRVNCTGTLICCKIFGGYMANNSGGSIVNIGSIYGMVSPKHFIYEYRHQRGEKFYKPIAYSVSKGSLYNLTKYLATYWGSRNVRVNCLTLAGVFNHQDAQFMEAYLKNVPMGRMADPNDYIGPLIFLSTSASKYVTGSNLVVDGGWTAW